VQAHQQLDGSSHSHGMFSPRKSRTLEEEPLPSVVKFEDFAGKVEGATLNGGARPTGDAGARGYR